AERCGADEDGGDRGDGDLAGLAVFAAAGGDVGGGPEEPGEDGGAHCAPPSRGSGGHQIRAGGATGKTPKARKGGAARGRGGGGARWRAWRRTPRRSRRGARGEGW